MVREFGFQVNNYGEGDLLAAGKNLNDTAVEQSWNIRGNGDEEDRRPKNGARERKTQCNSVKNFPDVRDKL